MQSLANLTNKFETDPSFLTGFIVQNNLPAVIQRLTQVGVVDVATADDAYQAVWALITAGNLEQANYVLSVPFNPLNAPNGYYEALQGAVNSAQQASGGAIMADTTSGNNVSFGNIFGSALQAINVFYQGIAGGGNQPPPPPKKDNTILYIILGLLVAVGLIFAFMLISKGGK